jgi:hypothetical protein
MLMNGIVSVTVPLGRCLWSNAMGSQMPCSRMRSGTRDLTASWKVSESELSCCSAHNNSELIDYSQPVSLTYVYIWVD